jgi:hypothetical protein
MPMTYEPIATQTLGSAVADVTFSSIPSTYTDLVVIANVQGQSNGCNIQIWFNGDGSGTNYSYTNLYYSGSSALSNRGTNAAKINFGTNGGQPFASASQFAINIYNIQNYSNTTTFKTALGTTRSPNGGYLGNGELDQAVGLWRNTNAITSISIGVDNSKTMQIGSTFTLYGIKAA